MGDSGTYRRSRSVRDRLWFLDWVRDRVHLWSRRLVLPYLCQILTFVHRKAGTKLGRVHKSFYTESSTCPNSSTNVHAKLFAGYLWGSLVFKERIRMSRIFSVIAVAAFGVAAMALLLGQVFGNYSEPPLSLEQKVMFRHFDPATVAYATREYDAAMTPGSLLGFRVSSGLKYLAYLVDGYATDPSKVSCERVLPRIQQLQGVLDRPEVHLTASEDIALRGLALVIEEAKKRDSREGSLCHPSSEPVQQVST